MNKPTKLFVLALFLLPSLSHAESGRTAGTTLQRTQGARPTGMGKSFVSVAEDINAMAFNPAGLARIDSPELTATYQKGFSDDSLGFFGYAHNLRFGTLYAGGTYMDGGSVDLNFSDGSHSKKQAQEDTVLMAGLALGPKGPLSIGVTVKGYRFELAETAHASGAAFDGGVYWKTPLEGLSMGAAVQNLGPDVKFEVESDPLPQTGRAGLSYLWEFERMGVQGFVPYSLLLSVDGVESKFEKTSVNTGFEIRRVFTHKQFTGNASLRGGYISEPKTLSFGLGTKVGILIFDYSFSFVDDLDDAQLFTLSLEFDPKG